MLRKFISDRGKIRARRVTGNCTQHQRDVATAVKNSREMALLPYTSHRSLREGDRSMKIILTHEVTGLGAAGDVVDVKDGYARNYLVPRGFAIRWTKGGEKDVDADPPCPPDPRDRTRSSRPTRSRASSRPSRSSWRPRRRRRPALRLRDPGRRRRGDQGRRWSGRGQAPCRARSRRSRPSARTRCPSTCTPRSRPTSTSRSSPPDLGVPRTDGGPVSHGMPALRRAAMFHVKRAVSRETDVAGVSRETSQGGRTCFT